MTRNEPGQEPASASQDLGDMLAQYGIDPSVLSGGSGGPVVYFGSGSGSYRVDGDVLRFRGGTKVTDGDVMKSLEQANAAFYEMTQPQLVNFQQKLVSGGILDPRKVRFGDYDDDTYSAY